MRTYTHVTAKRVRPARGIGPLKRQKEKERRQTRRAATGPGRLGERNVREYVDAIVVIRTSRIRSRATAVSERVRACAQHMIGYFFSYMYVIIGSPTQSLHMPQE